MSIRGLVLVAAGVACVGAAAAGGFIAQRMNQADRAVATVGAPNPPAPEEPKSATGPPAVDAPAQPAAISPARTTTAGRPGRPSQPTHGNPSVGQRTNASTASADPASSSVVAPLRPAPSPEGPGTEGSTGVPAIAAPPVTASTAAAPPTTSAVPPPASDPTPPADAPSPAPLLENVTVAKDSVIGIALDSPVSSATAKIEDAVSAHVARDVTVDGRVAIAAGARLEGVVSSVEHGGKFQTASRIGIKFTALVLADNTRIPIQTETIFRSGEPPTNQAASKIGATAVIGGILGALLGGHRGAAIGTAAGAAGGTAAVAAGDVDTVVFPAGTPLTVRLVAPVVITIQLDSGSGQD